MFYLSKEDQDGHVLRSQDTYSDYWEAAEAAFDWWRASRDKTLAVMRDGEIVSITEDGRIMEVYKPLLAE